MTADDWTPAWVEAQIMAGVITHSRRCGWRIGSTYVGDVKWHELTDEHAALCESVAAELGRRGGWVR